MRDTIQDYLTLSVADCKRLGFFKENETVTGVIRWNRNGSKYAEIGFGTKLTGVPVAVLSFSFNGEKKEQRIRLMYKHSNLKGNTGTNGGYYYFICPVSGCSCRKLYLSGNGFFVSRKALKVPYETQLRSHAQRSGVLYLCSTLYKFEDLIKQKNRRYTYKGKFTPLGRKCEKLKERLVRFDTSLLQAGAQYRQNAFF